MAEQPDRGAEWDDDPDRIPTQAELDAEDLAEMARTSRDRDLSALYPGRLDDPGAPPRPLVVHARVAWWGAAICGAILVVYGFLNLSMITDLLRQRLLDGLADDPRNSAPEDRVDSLAGFFPPFMLVMIVVLLAIQYPLLVAIANHHSRSCRSFFVATIIVNLLCVPIGVDLLFRYDEVWSAMVVISWIEFALLLLAGLLTMRRVVDRWLPPSTRMQPSKMFRAR
ncbi:hypothetical protein QSJ18_12515 [Gordonia sp. ABSL1-1]|uniref:hypothetical protein n=1 Tax=Gordonia sp. ABSL1-1 TaxID=3053923 RepID=UPI002572E32A|nr:hypothetical protein [Gordonia sp. ABSL1-1]MDL9937571.1 hypothetical protein [Gordonia sp. ABSL1-1]